MKKIITTFAFLPLFISAFTASGQSADSILLPSNQQFLELLPVVAPWFGTSNPGALTFLPVKGFSLAGMGYGNAKDELRYSQQPGKTVSYDLETRGYKKMGAISFYGRFKYLNQRYDDLMYNSTLIYDTWNPYLIGDTIPAKQYKEQFGLDGAFSYKISEKIILAAGVEYISAVGAKQKDPRNKNIISSLRISPGVIYNLGNLELGLSGSVYTYTNAVSISVEGNFKPNIFQFQGLGYYKNEVNIDSYSCRYFGSGYSTALQASFDKGKISNISELSVEFSSVETQSGSGYRMIDGIADNFDLAVNNHFIIRTPEALHTLDVSAGFHTVSGDEIIQKIIKVVKPLYSYDSLATVGWIKNKHLLSRLSLSSEYHYLRMRPDGRTGMKAGGGILLGSFSSEHFPLSTYGYMNALNLRFAADFSKSIQAGKFYITPEIDAFFRTNLNSDMKYVEQEKSFPEMVYRDYDYMRSSVMGGTLSLLVEKALNNGLIKSFFIKPQFSYQLSPDEINKTMNNSMTQVNFGITF